MKKLIIASLLLLGLSANNASAKTTYAGEKYGNTLNIGLGIGYYGYANGGTMPALHLDYEFDVAKSFTLAPFVTYMTYKNYYYWGNPHYPYREYYYRESVIPIGVKGKYYFDNILGAGPKWDFYLAGSLGFVIHKTVWEDTYYGDRNVSTDPSPLFLDLHIGTEYHLSKKAGLFLDLSTGISTLGLGLHL